MARQNRRVQVRDLRDAPALQPAAQPVRGFFAEQPKKLPDSDLTQVANALSDVNPQIQRALGQKQQITSMEDTAEAQRRYREARKPLREAIKAGEISEGQSPAFRRAWNQSHLRVKGKQFGSFLREQYANSDVSQSTDPGAAMEFAREKYDEFLEQNEDVSNADDIGMAEAFLPEVDQQINSLTQQHQAAAIRRTEQQARETLGTEIGLIVDETLAADSSQVIASAEGAQTVEEGRYEIIAQNVQSRVDEMIESGMNGSDANKIAIETLATTEDPEVMSEVLDRIKTGSGKLSGTKAAREAINAVEDKALREEIRRYRFENELQDDYQSDVREQQVDGYATELMTAITEAGAGERMAVLRDFDPFDYASQNGITNSETINQLARIDSTLTNASTNVQEDSGRIRQLYRQMMDDPDSLSQLDIIEGMGEYYSVSRGTSILNDFKTMTGGDGVAKDHPYLDLSGYRTAKNGINGSMKSLLDEGGVPELNATNAEFEFEMVMREYLMENPEVSKGDFLRKSREEMNSIVKHYNDVTDALQLGEGISPQDYYLNSRDDASGSTETTGGTNGGQGGASSQSAPESPQEGAQDEQTEYTYTMDEIQNVDPDVAKQEGADTDVIDTLNLMYENGEISGDEFLEQSRRFTQ